MKVYFVFLVLFSVSTQAFEVRNMDCTDNSAVPEAQKAFERAKGALSRLTGVKSVSISDCSGIWAGTYLEKLGIDKVSPNARPKPNAKPIVHCGVKVYFDTKENLMNYVNSVLILGSSIPYGETDPPKRVRTCGALAE